jgi:hypothetical protein
MNRICKILGFHGGDYEDCLFWDVTPRDFCKNRLFGGTYPEAIRSPETSAVIRTTQRNIPEYGILHKQDLLINTRYEGEAFQERDKGISERQKEWACIEQ